MTDQFQELLSLVMEKEIGMPKGRARTFAGHFVDIDEFLETDFSETRHLRSVTGKRALALTVEEIASLEGFQKSGKLDPSLSVSENMVASLGRHFTSTQLSMIRSFTLDKLSPNPLLIQALNLRTPTEVIHLNVYMTVGRSIVTSMGFFVEKLLLGTSTFVEKPPRGSGWDLIKRGEDGRTSWVQVKSGTNDMDKDQIVYWADKIAEKLAGGDSAFIGITYGKKEDDTVTLGLLSRYLPDWEMRCLIGRDLWDFVSDDPDYHTKLFEALRRAACQVLNSNSIVSEIEVCIKRLVETFTKKYGDGAEGVANYISAIF